MISRRGNHSVPLVRPIFLVQHQRAGTFAFNSSNQFSTTFICLGIARGSGRNIKNCLPSGETAYPASLALRPVAACS
jgi:hypothetical protein